MLDIDRYLTLRKLAHNNNTTASSTPTAALAPDLVSWGQAADKNWQKTLLSETARTSYVNANVSGGNNLTSFYLSGTYHIKKVMFIRMMKEAATVPFLPEYLMEIRNNVIISLSSRKVTFLEGQEEIKRIFKSRSALSAATNHLWSEMAKGYDLCINNPVFEIDCVLATDPVSMTEHISPCDMVFELEDKDDFLKDFLGTYLPDHQLFYDLKTFLCHVDYYQSEISGTRSHRYPLYTFCRQPLRMENAQQCRLQPRRSFELAGKYGWCNYSPGVAYNKGEDIIPATSSQIALFGWVLSSASNP